MPHKSIHVLVTFMCGVQATLIVSCSNVIVVGLHLACPEQRAGTSFMFAFARSRKLPMCQKKKKKKKKQDGDRLFLRGVVLTQELFLLSCVPPIQD